MVLSTADIGGLIKDANAVIGSGELKGETWKLASKGKHQLDLMLEVSEELDSRNKLLVEQTKLFNQLKAEHKELETSFVNLKGEAEESLAEQSNELASRGARIQQLGKQLTLSEARTKELQSNSDKDLVVANKKIAELAESAKDKTRDAGNLGSELQNVKSYAESLSQLRQTKAWRMRMFLNDVVLVGFKIFLVIGLMLVIVGGVQYVHTLAP